MSHRVLSQQLQMFMHPDELKHVGSGDYPRMSAHEAATTQTESGRIKNILKTGPEIHTPIVIGFQDNKPMLFDGHHRTAAAIKTNNILPVEYTEHTDPWDYAEEQVLKSAR